ncbi:MAG TPA: SRPBCC family protein [Planctomycetaceae bacterium]
MVARNESPGDAVDREIVVTRDFDAPRSLVFEAWTDPQHIGRWWGPRGFTTTTHEFDLRPGGVWRFVMHGPDGRDYKNKIVFLEVARPDRLAYKHAGDIDTADVTFHTTVTFAERDGGTRLTLRMVFDSAAERDRVEREYGAVEGGKQTLERLAEHLAAVAETRPGASADDREIVSTRVFAAPRRRVFEAFSDPAQLARWWGPKGFTNTFHEFDLRPGGAWRFTMHGPDGIDYRNEKHFLEVASPERVVFRHQVPIHGFQMTMTFAERDGGTRLTWRMLFDSAEECAKVRAFVVDANEQNLDRLERHLATVT